MSPKSKSFSKRLSIYVITITAILLLGVIALVSYFTSKIMYKESKQTAENELKSIIADINGMLSSVEASVNNIAWLVDDKLNTPDAMYELTEKLVSRNEMIVGSAIAFLPYYYSEKGYYFSPYTCKDHQKGTIKSFQMGNEDYDYPSMEWFQYPQLTKKPVWNEPYFDDGGGNMMMTTYSYPLLDVSGKMYAVLTADISLDDLTKRMSEIKPYPSSYTIMLAKNGTYLAAPEKDKILNKTLFSHSMENESDDLFRIADKMINGTDDAGYEVFNNINNVQCVAAYGHAKNGWSVAIICPTNEIQASSRHLLFYILLISLVGLVLMFILCRTAIRKLTAPLTEFSDAAREIAKGNFNAKLPVINTHDEMSQLQESFGFMQDSLVEYIQELKTTMSEKERIESELNIARNIQLNMVPTLFPNNLYATLQPAKEVGGDLYDFFEKNGYLYFAIGDVSGKGVPAALVMAITRSAFHFMCSQEMSICEIMSQVNNMISNGNKEFMFVTMFAGKLNLSNGELEYCNAGHNPVANIDENGNAKFLKAKPNLAVGLCEDFPYQGEKTTLAHGSKLVLYTDGVTEAEKKNKEQYEEGRLLEFLATNSSSDCKQLTNKLYDDVKCFVDGNEPNDDITILTIEV